MKKNPVSFLMVPLTVLFSVTLAGSLASCGPGDPAKAFVGDWRAPADPVKGRGAIAVVIEDGGKATLHDGGTSQPAAWGYDAKVTAGWLAQVSPYSTAKPVTAPAEALRIVVKDGKLVVFFPKPEGGFEELATFERAAQGEPLPVKALFPFEIAGYWVSPDGARYLDIKSDGSYQEKWTGGSAAGKWKIDPKTNRVYLAEGTEEPKVPGAWELAIDGAKLRLSPTGPSAAQAPREFAKASGPPKATSFYDQYNARGERIGEGNLITDNLQGFWVGRRAGSTAEEAWSFNDGIFSAWPLPASDTSVLQRSAGYSRTDESYSASGESIEFYFMGDPGASYTIEAVYADTNTDGIGGFDLAKDGVAYQFVRVPDGVLYDEGDDYAGEAYVGGPVGPPPGSEFDPGN